VAGDDCVLSVDQDGIAESEFADAGGNLGYLLI
jgi:hypothetical protein